MMVDEIPSLQNEGDLASINEQKSKSLITDIKTLLKLPVLMANVLPVFTGFWLALYYTNTSFIANIGLFFLVLLGSTFVMGGALVINNWYDVDIDRIMERTKKRPTVTGSMSLQLVLTMGISLTIVGFVLLFFTSIEASIYAFIGWFTYVFLYTMWAKRRYAFNTVIGSVSGAVTPLIGWAVIDSAFHIVPIILAVIIFIWQMPHTFAIAMRKYEEYRAAKVAMLPVVRGFRVTKWQSFLYVACLIPLPFFLTSLGMVFIIVATVLNVLWLVMSVYGFFTKDDKLWAKNMFIYSVGYLTLLFVTMVIGTLPSFS
ncbi:heme o synthase [Salipaludibacillus sp. HK11]|uniref:heme o synthase n=1 Tax=Salipaludibacillus sp. HK11 TaxID=3394320 RepID=UPI0039FDC68B